MGLAFIGPSFVIVLALSAAYVRFGGLAWMQGAFYSRTSVEIMEVFQNLNDKGLTIAMVTHEQDISQFARRRIVFRDGRIRKDETISDRLLAHDVRRTMPEQDD